MTDMGTTSSAAAAAVSSTATNQAAGGSSGVPPEGTPPKRDSPIAVFRQMPVMVKISAVWLMLIFGGAIYAKIDTVIFDGALPLQDPNFQTNNFNPETGEFGDGETLASPSAQHWLGTDAIARDTFARIVHGGWVSLIVAMVAAGFGIIVGGFLGSLVGFVRGKTEIAIMSIIDVILAFPALILLLALVSIFKVRDLFVISLVIGFLSIPAYTRVSRAMSLAISNREFVLAAQAIGTRRATILRREIIPNVLPTVVSYAMVAAAFVIVVEGSLSFLGLSVQLPTATWGNMINQARADININLLQVIAPALALVLTVLSLNQVGDWLQKRSSFRGSAL